jgi:hypothetical protein
MRNTSMYAELNAFHSALVMLAFRRKADTSSKALHAQLMG